VGAELKEGKHNRKGSSRSGAKKMLAGSSPGPV